MAIAGVPVVEVPPPVPSGTIYLVRHGLVHNPIRMMYGWLPRFRLADEGRRQVEAAATYLAERETAVLVTSQLLRARPARLGGSAGSLELGETMAAMASRVQAALALALRLSGGRPAICVSHRDPIAALRLKLEEPSFEDLHVADCMPASVTWQGGAVRIHRRRLRRGG